MRMTRYLRLVALTAALGFGLIWAWVAAMPMAFMESEYASWHARQTLLDRCDLGEVIILGDSRAAADIMPDLLPMRATNLAIGGGEAIEALAILTRALACPTPPRLVILSFDPGHFTHADLFWERSVRFGLLSAADIAALRTTTAATGDTSVYEAHHTDGVPSLLRDWLNEVRFPPYYFSALVHAGVGLRWWHNRQVMAETLAARGQAYFGTAPGSDIVALEGHMARFQARPVLNVYFDRILALLNSHAIESLFVGMPINEATFSQVDPALRDGFAAFLSAYESRYPGFHVAGDIMPHWPDRLFGDQFCHLNPQGAALFSAQLAQRLQEAPPRTQNDAQNEWLRATGAAASARVQPISKRGS